MDSTASKEEGHGEEKKKKTKKKKKKRRRRAQNHQDKGGVQDTEGAEATKPKAMDLIGGGRQDTKFTVSVKLSEKSAMAASAAAAAVAGTNGVSAPMTSAVARMAEAEATPTSGATAITGTEKAGKETAKFNCSKCPGAGFAESTDFRAHFRSDWHRYNLKAKIRGLSAVDLDTFTRMTADEVASFMAKDL